MIVINICAIVCSVASVICCFLILKISEESHNAIIEISDHNKELLKMYKNRTPHD